MAAGGFQHLTLDVHAILGAAPLCHVGYVADGAPYATLTLHWREGEVCR